MDIAGDWIERLSIRRFVDGGYRWAMYIKTYPGLLLLYSLGISALRTGKINFLKEVISRQVYSHEYRHDNCILDVLNPWNVFYDRIPYFIEPGFERRFSPVSDHLAPLLKSKIYATEEEARYLDWFDFFEFLLSFKSVQQGEYPYFGSFAWRWETKQFMIKMLQDTVVKKGRYGVAISNFLGGDMALEETAPKYDDIAIRARKDYGRSSPPNYITELIQLTKVGTRISSYEELVKHLRSDG